MKRLRGEVRLVPPWSLHNELRTVLFCPTEEFESSRRVHKLSASTKPSTAIGSTVIEWRSGMTLYSTSGGTTKHPDCTPYSGRKNFTSPWGIPEGAL
ncbi:hypothetical protein MRX96_050938 [Rhipicephalus microplus]